MSTCASSSFADVVSSSWIGGDVQAGWHNAARWSNGIPNNSGSTAFQAIINAVSPTSGPIVTISQATSIDSLNIGPRVQVNVDTFGGFKVANGISGDGTIQLSFISTLTGSSGPLTIGSGITVNGGGGTIGLANQPLDNYGKIAGGLIMGSPIRNHGQIGGATFFGTYSLAELGQLTGPAYETIGTLLLNGSTLSVRAGTPSWTLGGTIKDGTIETGDGRTIFVPYVFYGPIARYPRLDNVEMNADLVISNNTLTIVDGQLRGRGSVLLHPQAGWSPGRIVSGTPTLTIGADISVRAGGSTSSTAANPTIGDPSGFGTRTLINHGTLSTDPPPLYGYTQQAMSLFGTTIFNDGTLVIADTGWIYAARGTHGFEPNTLVTFGAGGVLDVDLSPNANLGLLNVVGTLDLTTPGDQLALGRGAGTSDGTFYRIVTTSVGITGQFDSVTPGFEVEYRNGTEIWARYVPEPSSAIAIGLLIVLPCRRRR